LPKPGCCGDCRNLSRKFDLTIFESLHIIFGLKKPTSLYACAPAWNPMLSCDNFAKTYQLTAFVHGSISSRPSMKSTLTHVWKR
jgi:hypothetical protein